jgi:F0F1-type ATP synthase assembly protein I
MSSPKKPPKPNFDFRTAGALSAIAIQMGAIIYFMVQIGKWIDNYFESGSKIGLIVFTLLGIVISMWFVINETKKLQK